MSNNQQNPDLQESNLLYISSSTNDLVEREMMGEDEQIKAETKALVETIKKRTQLEIENAQVLTKNICLQAIRGVREAIEHNELLNPERIEQSVITMQKDIDTNWQKTVNEISALNDRLQEAAQAAWDILSGQNNLREK